jgi:hypothetical protein
MMQQAEPVSPQQLREQISQSVRQAQVAAEQAAKAAAQADQQAQTVEIHSGPPVAITTVPGRPFPDDIPPRVAGVAMGFFVTMAFIIVGFPIARAIGRKIDRGSSKPQSLSPDVRQELQQLSASVEAIAIEVERISEGQRFTTRLLTEKQPSISGQ